jgi:membrane-associated PAP2 superfamily phosphatase
MSEIPSVQSKFPNSSAAPADPSLASASSLAGVGVPVLANAPATSKTNAPAWDGAATSPDSLVAFWWRRIRVPLAFFVVLASLFAFTHADLRIARAVFFDSARGDWIGNNNWWTNQFIHEGGTWFVRSLVLAALAIAGWSLFDSRLRTWRRPALYFAVSVILSVGSVGALKTVTNKDCPRDLAQFGGEHTYVPLFGQRPAGLKNARCFPAAHASAGYALLALYFMFRERNRRWGRIGLAIGLLTGVIFGISQQSRGAHFVSHDVWSAFIVWTVSLSTYVGLFRARLWRATADLATG